MLHSISFVAFALALVLWIMSRRDLDRSRRTMAEAAFLADQTQRLANQCHRRAQELADIEAEQQDSADWWKQPSPALPPARNNRRDYLGPN